MTEEIRAEDWDWEHAVVLEPQTKLPKTDSLVPRPVWVRHMRRTILNTEPMPHPTDEEKHDAILVLHDPVNAIIPGLWNEAHQILDESSR